MRVALLFLCFPVLLKAQFMHKTPIWHQGANDIFAYFVYGLTVSQKGTVLAFSEARIHDGKDDGAHHIVMWRSTDGRSSILVESKDGECWANPTVVEDRETNELFLFYALNENNVSSRLFYKSTKDDGASWSQPIELSHLFGNEWTFHLPGPGHGIQTRNKRLIIPVWHRNTIALQAKERNYGVNCMYSDDHGKTWKVGGNTPVGELNESQIVELKNGDLLLIGRTLTAGNGVSQAAVISTDGGRNWSSPIQYVNGLTGKACDIGLTRYAFKPDVPYLRLSIRSDRPEELGIEIFRQEGSAPMERCAITATMGNYARLRKIYLKDEVITSTTLYAGYDDVHFAEKESYPYTRFVKDKNGDFIIAAETNESFAELAGWPQEPAYLNRINWRYRPAYKLTQYWRKESSHFDTSLSLRVNGRVYYWSGGSRNKSHYIRIPGGAAFENFELREKFHQGQRFYFGITRKSYAELLK
jgi:Neuraminidase (sialidase)